MCYQPPGMDDLPEAPDTSALVGSAVVFYVLMTLLGLAAMSWQDLEIGREVFGDGTTLPRDTLLGAGSGLAVVALTRLLGRWAPMRRLEQELSSLLGRPGSVAIAVLAVTSAVGEEVLFRGALQPLLGLVLTAIVFGLVHGGPTPRFRAWALFALLAGLLLGWLEEFTGNLLAPILCHLTVNYFNLHHIATAPESAGGEAAP